MENVRKDLNDMVAKINLKKEEGRYSEKYLCKVTLFNGVVIDFVDRDKILDLLKTKQECGTLDGFIKSRELVEEVKSTEVVEGDFEDVSTYICVNYVLNFEDKERTFKFFLANPKVDRQRLIEYYNLFKSKQRSNPKPQTQVK